MSLDLAFPAERTAPAKDLEIRPRQVKAWIETLPLQQSLEGCRALNAHLAAMNRARFDLDDRIQILEIYRPFAAVILEELENIYGKSSLPLGPRAREALALARNLVAGMAVGYKIAIAEKSSKLIAFGARKQLPLLMLRAVECLQAVLRAGYKSYTPAPHGTWYELHQLYLQAERENLAREPADPETRGTVFDAYAHTLLLSLIDPYRLVPGEMEKLMALLNGARSLATLGQSRPATPGGGHFIVPCDQDRPPKPVLSPSDETGGPNFRLLDTNAVVDKLRARKNALETGQVSAMTARAMGREGPALLGKLIVLWGDPPKRAHRREATDATAALCVGMKAVSHFIAREGRIDPVAEAEALRNGITLPIPALLSDDGAQPVPVFEWRVVNRSPGGAKLCRAGAVEQSLAVGEIVGLKLEDRPRWTLGVVRWITALDEGGMEFGVQFLSSGARMVWVQPVVNASPQAKLGLLLEAEEEGGAESLLAPPATYADMREFELDQQGVMFNVRAGRLVERGGRFDLFQVARTGIA